MSNVTIERDGPVAILRLDREDKRNALSIEMRDEIERAFHAFASTSDVHVVVLTGGRRVFSSGYDLEEVVRTDLESFVHRDVEFWTACYGFPKPVVAAVGGWALDGGLDLALAADIILAAKDATFGHPEVAFGVPPLFAPLARFVGRAWARVLCLTGETFGVDEARRIGLVHRVVASKSLLEEAARVATGIASYPPGAAAVVKRVGGGPARLVQKVAEELKVIRTAYELAPVKAALKQYARDRLGISS
jgi:enoyl-CoA hydratase/carnithine racemase